MKDLLKKARDIQVKEARDYYLSQRIRDAAEVDSFDIGTNLIVSLIDEVSALEEAIENYDFLLEKNTKELQMIDVILISEGFDIPGRPDRIKEILEEYRVAENLSHNMLV